MQFFDRVLDRQPVAVPAGDVLRVKPSELLGLDDHVLEHFVECVANVQLAIGVGRAVVQHKQGRADARCAQALVQAGFVPLLDPGGLALGQVAAHGEGRVGQVQGAAVVNFVGHGKSRVGAVGQKGGRLVACATQTGSRRVARGKVRQRARSNSGVQPGARLNAVTLYALRQGFQTVVFEFVVQFM